MYVHDGVLFGVPFDPARLELRGAAVPLLEDLAADPTSGAGEFSFSGMPSGPGTFVYRTGRASDPGYPVSWLDNSGKTQPLIATFEETDGVLFLTMELVDGRPLSDVTTRPLR